ncbi:Ger(x)C family spore germination protein [Cohnella nanjingensis]|uniref:Ger(X)C family spore germination protein n=1 Tax=Cohnella nanjingensis TaxID=1387779 RepID=A0A7X0RLD0_9BACL|nr:Ger(x)C family spore germination protein [Cohnella nanjingensis]MBB6669618.1 Ger(x)C family spore germination protein [Cohnella nanjingensis]
MKAAACWLLMLVCLAGCTDQRVLEKMGFIRTISFDVAGQDNANMLKVTISIPKSSQNESIVYTTVAHSSKQARAVFDRQNDRRLVNGQIRQILFGEALAKQGIWKHLDATMRDPSVGIHAHVVVAEGDTEKMLSRKYPQGGTAGEYIDNLLRAESATRDIPHANLHTFIRDYYDDGIEPVATILKETPSSLLIDGVALFKKDKYVARVPAADKMYFGLLRDSVDTGELNMDDIRMGKESLPVSLSYIHSRRKIRFSSVKGLTAGTPLKVTIHLRIRGSLLEFYGGEALDNAANQKKLEAGMSRYVEEKCNALIALMQQNKTDSIGIGQHVRNAMKYASWRQLEWDDTFSKADITVRADVKIKDIGKLTRS